MCLVQGIGANNPDPWLMRTKHQDPTAVTRFTTYFKNVSRLLGAQLTEHEVEPQINRDEICNQFALCSRDAKPILTEPKAARQTSLGMTKIYFNSHRLSERSLRSGTGRNIIIGCFVC